MKSNTTIPDEEVGTVKRWVLITLILSGLLLVAISITIPEQGGWNYLRTLLRELGVVLLAVFTVSLLYEVHVARKYLTQFLTLLRHQMEQGESNAAVCANLGILEIFATRDLYESKYPLEGLVSQMAAGSTMRIVARSLLLLMLKTAAIKKAIEQGAHVELCLFDPDAAVDDNLRMTHLEITDIQSALTVFRKEIAEWVSEAKPAGSIQLKYHNVLLFDSFSAFSYGAQGHLVWDLSFGRDLMAKRIFMLEPTKPLGSDLYGRYDKVWNTATDVFLYDGNEVKLNRLPSLSR